MHATLELGAHAPGSVVVLLRGEMQYDGIGLPEPPRWMGYCNAFAVKQRLSTVLITAEHCVPERELALGEIVRFEAPSGWGHGKAQLAWRDTTHDAAVLLPLEPAALQPFVTARPPLAGERVESYSALFDAWHVGAMGGELAPGSGLHVSTLTIAKGWSGSPMLDAHGAAWGIVSMCTPRDDGVCEPGSSKAYELPPLQ
jgi:hypothetical protein